MGDKDSAQKTIKTIRRALRRMVLIVFCKATSTLSLVAS